jgi:hypothetical protein
MKNIRWFSYGSYRSWRDNLKKRLERINKLKDDNQVVTILDYIDNEPKG